MERSQYYLGVVSCIEDDDLLPNAKEYHEILVDIPEIAQKVKAFPKRGEIDEPKVGDPVLLLSLDPLYNSYMIYEKVKDSNDFIGFRASGKMVDITPERIVVGVFKEDVYDYPEDEKWDKAGEKKSGGSGSIGDNHITSVIIDNKGTITVEAAKDNGDEGNLIVYLKGKTDITIDGDDGNTVAIKNDSNVKIEGQSTVEITKSCSIKCQDAITIEATKDCTVKGQNVNVEAQAKCTVKAPQAEITGGQLTIKGTATPDGQGPFCGLPACLFTGCVHNSSLTTT